jgi:electron transport complex protein RnfG
MISKSKLYPIIIVTLVVSVSMTALIAVDSHTRPIIEKRKWEEMQRQIGIIFPYKNHTEHLKVADVYVVKNIENETIGYAFWVIGKGYGGKIEMLLGTEVDGSTIRGLSVISQQETPQIGSRINESSFRDQFQGKNINTLSITKDGNVDAISGATISSKAVVNAVKSTATDKYQILQDEGVIVNG